ncbi:MAG: hypothetical protein IKQ80_00960 [Clostridia bacterium]|nr:hypothetical protein [Clostridia bacterium]
MTFSDGTRSASRNDGGRPLWEGHRERLRRRLEREGWEALKPHEMVELVLNYAVPRQDLSDVARLLVDRFGSVGGVFCASREQLLAVGGVTDTLAEWIGLTGDLMRAYFDLHTHSDIRLSCCQEVRAFLQSRSGGAAGGRPLMICADFSFNLIACVELEGQGEWFSADNVRRMLTDAIDNGARYVFLVLVGDGAPPELGQAQSEGLDAIAVTLRGAGIDLLDCLLTGGGEVISLNAQGRLQAVRAESGRAALHEYYTRK